MTGEEQRLIITIDGPAGTGKSTVAHHLAQRLGLEFLDTGAMYRAAALLAIELAIDPQDGAALAIALAEHNLHFDWSADPPHIMLSDRDVSDRIRHLDVSGVVSTVAAQAEVRRALVDQQRGIAARHPRIVTEGRDQGSVVFPGAAIKFFLLADVNTRAERRIEQLARAGRAVDQDTVRQDIERRDRIDSTRADGPLVKPSDAIEIDTSNHSIDEVVGQMEYSVRQRLAGALG